MLDLIELEAERCSLDSLGALTDEHYWTNTIAVLLSHEVCTAMIRTHRCGLDRDSRARLAALFIQISTGIQIKNRNSLLTSVVALKNDDG